MSVISRSWLAFAAIGAGVVHLALVISSSPLIAVVLAILGSAEIVWGTLILIRDRLLVPRIAQSVAIAPVVLWSLLTVTATLLNTPQISDSLLFIPMAIASIFNLFIALVLSVHLKRAANPRHHAGEPKPVSAVRYLSAIFIAGVLVGGLTSPALAATQAGSVATHHGGTMGGMMTMDMSGH